MTRTVQPATFAAFGSPHPLALRTDVPAPAWEQVAWRHTDFLSLYLVRRGRATHVIEDQPFEVARGDVYAMQVGQAHWFERCDRLVLDTIHVQPALFSATTWELLGGLGSGRWLHLTPTAHAQIAACWSELRDEWERDTPEAGWLLGPLFGRLLVRLGRVGTQRGESGRHEDTVAIAVRYLEEHFTEPVRMEQLAAQVCLSPDRLTEVFTQGMGQTPRDYLKHLRLERARNLLTSTQTPISQVGLLSGFSDPAYFARIFKENVGVSPRLWRESCKQRQSG